MKLIECKCGGKPQFKELTGWWYVECPKCGRQISARYSRENAADMWNYCRRVDVLEEKERSEHGKEKQNEGPAAQRPR